MVITPAPRRGFFVSAFFLLRRTASRPGFGLKPGVHSAGFFDFFVKHLLPGGPAAARLFSFLGGDYLLQMLQKILNFIKDNRSGCMETAILPLAAAGLAAGLAAQHMAAWLPGPEHAGADVTTGAVGFGVAGIMKEEGRRRKVEKMDNLIFDHTLGRETEIFNIGYTKDNYIRKDSDVFKSTSIQQYDEGRPVQIGRAHV